MSDGDSDRNVISGNNTIGIQILGSASTGEILYGNFIGPDATGNGALTRSALGDPAAAAQPTGIQIVGSTGDDIGEAGEPVNVISGNQVGIEVAGIVERFRRQPGSYPGREQLDRHRNRGRKDRKSLRRLPQQRLPDAGRPARCPEFHRGQQPGGCLHPRARRHRELRDGECHRHGTAWSDVQYRAPERPDGPIPHRRLHPGFIGKYNRRDRRRGKETRSPATMWESISSASQARRRTTR